MIEATTGMEAGRVLLVDTGFVGRLRNHGRSILVPAPFVLAETVRESQGFWDRLIACLEWLASGPRGQWKLEDLDGRRPRRCWPLGEEESA